MRLPLSAVAVVALVAACASPIPVPPGPAAPAPPGFPDAYYRQAAAQGARVLRVDAAGSLVTIEVRRGGSLARLGHDHVIASHDVQGYVAPGAGRADLYLPLERLAVDEPALRAEAQLDTQPTADDVAGTRRNMLKSLEAARYPFALISVSGPADRDGVADMRVTVTLHGIARALQVPVRVAVDGDAIEASGSLGLKQTDFGIVPMSVLGGAIQVRDEVELRFRIRALRVPAPSDGALRSPRAARAAVTPVARPTDPA